MLCARVAAAARLRSCHRLVDKSLLGGDLCKLEGALVWLQLKAALYIKPYDVSSMLLPVMHVQ